jgi:hypothetical protein
VTCKSQSYCLVSRLPRSCCSVGTYSWMLCLQTVVILVLALEQDSHLFLTHWDGEWLCCLHSGSSKSLSSTPALVWCLHYSEHALVSYSHIRTLERQGQSGTRLLTHMDRSILTLVCERCSICVGHLWLFAYFSVGIFLWVIFYSSLDKIKSCNLNPEFPYNKTTDAVISQIYFG